MVYRQGSEESGCICYGIVREKPKECKYRSDANRCNDCCLLYMKVVKGEDRQKWSNMGLFLAK